MLQGEVVDLKPFDAQLMLPVDKTPVSLVLDGTHVGRGLEWSVFLSLSLISFTLETDFLTYNNANMVT